MSFEGLMKRVLWIALFVLVLFGIYGIFKKLGIDII